MYAEEAAVELMIGHRWWLAREDFIDAFVEWDGLDLAMAWVHWPAAVAALGAGRLVCSSSEAAVLQIAASIVEGTPVALGEAVSSLDGHHAVLVARAVLHAAGGQGGTAVPGAWR